MASAGLADVPEEEHSYVMQLHDDIFMIPIEFGRREPAVRVSKGTILFFSSLLVVCAGRPPCWSSSRRFLFIRKS